jgi:DNA polymerase III subunit chi
MTDIWFYELTREPADNVLPGLLAKHYQRGDRVAVTCASKTMVDELSARLWAMEDVSFVAHGSDGEPAPEHQPIWITTADENPNAATFRYLVEGKMPDEVDAFSRVSIMFDSNEDQKTKARDTWKRVTAQGHAVKYWKKDDAGKWVDQALKA